MVEASLWLGLVDPVGQHGEAQHPEAQYDLTVELGSQCNIMNSHWYGLMTVLGVGQCLRAILVCVGVGRPFWSALVLQQLGVANGFLPFKYFGLGSQCGGAQ